MPPQTMAKLIGGAVLILVLVIAGAQATYIVQPGFRGVQVTLGTVTPKFKPEGFGMKSPFISTIIPLSVRQKSVPIKSVCVSKDLQEVVVDLSVLYRIPERSVVEIFQKYKGDPFASLISPRVDEALKEVTKEHTAQEIVQKRAEVKERTLASARQKVGEILDVVDVVVENIELSAKLEAAIERKMVQEQEANKAVFQQQQMEVEAQTAIISAKGEAESIQIRGQALNANPAFLDLQIVETWNGKTPRIVGGAVGGMQMILPLGRVEVSGATNSNSNSQ
jgi:prohibitin 2